MQITRPVRDVTWRLWVSYVGTQYVGWQKQAACTSVCSMIEAAFAKVVAQPVALTVAGRTDSGVHANGQVVSCRFSSRFDGRSLVLALAQHLPVDVAVWRADEMPHDFNAKLHSVGKQYVYELWQGLSPDPFIDAHVWHVRRPVEIASMQEAAQYLLGEQDLESFRSIYCDASHARRTIWQIQMSQTGDLVRFDIRGNAFCRNMVRIIVGTLVDVGTSRTTPARVLEILKAKNRHLAGPTAPAKGLRLASVYFPDELGLAAIPAGYQFPRYPVTSTSWPFAQDGIKIGPVVSKQSGD